MSFFVRRRAQDGLALTVGKAFRWRVVGRWSQRMAIWLGGIGVALIILGFAETTQRAFALFQRALAWHPAAAFVLVPAGLAAVVALTVRYFPNAKGSGIPQAIAALGLPPEGRKGVLSLRIAFAKIVLTSIGLAVGASAGREGPSVQVGASLMMRLGAFFHLRNSETARFMILAGGAAGIAAAFNTPIAGVVFAIEELSRSYEERTSGTVMTAVILSGVTSLALVGYSPYFGRTAVGTVTMDTLWIAVALIGIVGGLLGGIFSQTLVVASRHGLPGAVGRLARGHPVVFAAACGLVLAAIGLVSDNLTYGTGYKEARLLLEGGTLPDAFFPLKMLATLVSYLSGIPGGLFSPSLSAGAGLGCSMSPFFPDVSTKVCVLLGMAAYFTGVVQSPITAAIIVMEMTDNQYLTVPLMASAFVALGASRMICPHPLYKALAINFLTEQRDHLCHPAAPVLEKSGDGKDAMSR